MKNSRAMNDSSFMLILSSEQSEELYEEMDEVQRILSSERSEELESYERFVVHINLEF